MTCTLLENSLEGSDRAADGCLVRPQRFMGNERAQLVERENFCVIVETDFNFGCEGTGFEDGETVLLEIVSHKVIGALRVFQSSSR
jgi:hypothetical protein